MLMNLRRSLLISAAARNLAVDLVREHGAAALDILDRALSIADEEKPRGACRTENGQLLAASRTHVLSLVELLPETTVACADRADVDEIAGKLSKKAR